MSHYVIRLDDACPTMNHANWNRMEYLLDKYSVRPIVGVIRKIRIRILHGKMISFFGRGRIPGRKKGGA